MVKNDSSGKVKTGIKEYEKGFLLAVMIILTGTLMEWISKGRGIAFPSYPLNIIIGFSLIGIIILLHIFFRNTHTIKILSRVPVSLSAIFLFTILVLLMGLIKQDHADNPPIYKLTGMNHIRNSFIFFLSGFYLLFTLGLVIMRRITSFTVKNIGFALNHIGLWIIIFAGSMGSGDMLRLSISINENQTLWYGFDRGFRPVILPFTIKLLDFRMEEYPAKILVVDEKDVNFEKNIRDYLYEIKEGTEINVNNWNFRVLKYIPEAERDSTGYRSSSDTLTSQAALIRVKNEPGGINAERWISTGHYLATPDYIIFDSSYMLGMTIPEPKDYTSMVEIVTNDGKSDTADIKVNKPYKAGGYKLYQLSYDESKGKYSKMSVIEAIWDPWLPLVYAGIFMVIAGACYLFWVGRNPKI
jgi:hypothetical protein